MAVAVLSLTPLSAAYALRPLRVAWNLGWCDHDYPRWGGHNPSSRARHTGFSHRVGAPTTPRAGFRPFVANRNIRHFVWYGGVAGEGLRSDGVDDLPLSKSVCSILPIARHFRAGVLRGSGLYTALGRAFWDLPSLARPFALRPAALRGTSRGETMTIPGGARTLRNAHSPVLGAPVSLIRSGLPPLSP